MRHSTLIVVLTAFAACGDGDTPRNADAADDTIGDTSPADTSPADTSPEDTSPADTSPADTSPDDTANPQDTGAPDTASPDSDTPDASTGDYLTRCESFFAARVLEMQIARDPAFPSDCDTPLVTAIGRLKPNGAPLCNAGESPNACRDRHYATPPELDALGQGCWNEDAPASCLRATYLPRCADGGDDCAEPEVVCQDGTRPMVYREAATVGPSDAWLFHLGGEGGPCAGAGCWLNYKQAQLGADAPFSFAMSTLHPDGPENGAQAGRGVASGDPALPYARLNRVRFERCTDGASDAVEQAPVYNGVPPELAAQYPDFPVATAQTTIPVWHRGLATWLAAFHHMTTLEGRDRDGDGVPEIPSLADARLVILSAASDASMWLTFSADTFAEELRAIAGPDVDVRIMIDGNFGPSLDNEARYHPEAPAGFDMLADPYSETGLCLLPDNEDGVDNEACSAAGFGPGSRLRIGYEHRNVRLDASCEAFHGAQAPECYDRNHTLFHHVATPFLVLADQEDNTISDGPPVYAEDPSYFWHEPATYRERVVDQAWDLVDSWTSGAREEGAGTPGDMILILPKARREGEPWGKATHVRFHDDAEMARAMTLCTAAADKVATVPFNQMLGGWFTDQLPQTFAIEDARRPLPNGNVWVTGSACRAPE